MHVIVGILAGPKRVGVCNRTDLLVRAGVVLALLACPVGVRGGLRRVRKLVDLGPLRGLAGVSLLCE